MSVAVFLICLLCLGWTLRLIHLLDSELREVSWPASPKAAAAAMAAFKRGRQPRAG